jgi:hypothetical protein
MMHAVPAGTKRRVQQTSIDSYRTVDLCDKQQTVLVAISAYPDSTDRELARNLGFSDPNNVRPRRFELVEMGYVIASGKRVCTVSGKTALTWRINR